MEPHGRGDVEDDRIVRKATRPEPTEDRSPSSKWTAAEVEKELTSDGGEPVRKDADGADGGEVHPWTGMSTKSLRGVKPDFVPVPGTELVERKAREDADAIEKAVEDWLDLANPDGFDPSDGALRRAAKAESTGVDWTEADGREDSAKASPYDLDAADVRKDAKRDVEPAAVEKAAVVELTRNAKNGGLSALQAGEGAELVAAIADLFDVSEDRVLDALEAAIEGVDGKATGKEWPTQWADLATALDTDGAEKSAGQWKAVRKSTGATIGTDADGRAAVVDAAGHAVALDDLTR